MRSSQEKIEKTQIIPSSKTRDWSMVKPLAVNLRKG